MPVSRSYPGVYVEEIPSGVKTIAGVPTSITVFVGPARRGRVNRPGQVRNFAGFEMKFGGLAVGLETGYAVQQYFLNGGQDAWIVRVAKKPNLRQLQKALQALDAVDLFNLLVLPGITTAGAVGLAAGYCRRRRAFLIVDPPAGAATPTQIEAALPVLTPEEKRSAAIYFPWIRLTDPLANGQPRLSPPGGTIAGLMVRTDGTRGVWKAPAGTEATLKGVLDLAAKLTDGENGKLNSSGINGLRVFPVNGPVAWGARTLAGDDQAGDEFKYIPVRRTALFIEESLSRGIKWAVFEPNGEPLWLQLRLSIGAFLQGLFRQGAFAGGTPKEAYYAKCDRETTTQADIDAGVVNIVVGFAPLKPAEFVILKFQQLAGSVAQ